MKLLHRKGRWPQLQFKSATGRVAFFVALLAIGAAFWLNAQRQLENITDKKVERAALHDVGNTLEDSQKQALAMYQQQFFTAYGIRLHLAIVPEDVPHYVPPDFGSTPFVAVVLSIEEKTLGFVMSPLVEAALSTDWLEKISTTVLLPLMHEGKWPAALNAALNALSSRLQEVMGKGNIVK